MADPLANQNALFNQYESEYCSKSTDISRKVQALSSFSAGETDAVFVKLFAVARSKYHKLLECRCQTTEDKGD